jgi:hypothetical protein
MSHTLCESGAMKKQRAYCPVVLEPELEEETALFTAIQRQALARKFRRWARQLDVSAFIMLRNQQQACEPKPPPCLKAVSAHALWTN